MPQLSEFFFLNSSEAVADARIEFLDSVASVLQLSVKRSYAHYA